MRRSHWIRVLREVDCFLEDGGVIGFGSWLGDGLFAKCRGRLVLVESLDNNNWSFNVC